MVDPIMRHDELPTISSERLARYLEALQAVENLITWYPNRKYAHTGQHESAMLIDALTVLRLLRLPLVEEELAREAGGDG